MKLPINWEAFLTLSLLLTMNKSVTSKFILLLSLIRHTFSSGYLISILLRRLLISCNLKSCELDPLPPFIIADVVDDIAPFLLYLFNRSLSEGFLPDSQKRALVFPTLKSPNLDPDLCQNYRPISNLSFLS